MLLCGRDWDKGGRQGDVGEGDGGEGDGDVGGDLFLKCLDKEGSCICSRVRELDDDDDDDDRD